MARVFNGTNQAMSRAINLSSFNQASLSFWLWWDTFANNDKLAFEYTANFNSNSGFIVDPNSGAPASGNVQVGFHTASPVRTWVDQFTRPSAAAWHHWVVTFDTANVVNTAYIDGVAQTLTTASHAGSGTSGAFSNSSLFFMSRNGASLFGAGRMAEVALWGGVVLTARQVLALSTGYPPQRIGPLPIAYWPLLGDTPEPDYSGLRQSLTLSNSPTIANQPPIQGKMAPGRGFQPMPV